MRVTLDVDRPSQIVLLSRYYTMKYVCGVDEIRVSAGGNGFHFIRRGLKITYEQALQVRALLGECNTRLEFDTEASLKPTQILWKSKNGHKLRHIKFPEIRLVDGEIVLEGGNGSMARTITERDLLALPFTLRPPREVFLRKR